MTSFIAQLKAQLEQVDWPVVVAALRSENRLWAKLADSDFGALALEAIGSEINRWSPGFLGLLSLEQEAHFSDLQSKPFKAVSEKLRHEAGSVYEALAADAQEDEETSQPHTNSPDLEQATWLALALRERFRLAASWDNLPQDLAIAPPAFWRLPLACLIGLLPEPKGLLTALLAEQASPELRKVALQALLANPAKPEQQFALLVDAVGNAGLAQWSGLLRAISGQRSDLAGLLAAHALANLPEQIGEVERLDQLEALMQQSEILQLGGQHEEALPLLSTAWEAAQRFQAGLAAKLAESAAHNKGGLTGITALEQVTQVGADPTLGKSMDSAHGGKHPASLIAAGRVALRNGDRDEAQTMADAAFTTIQADSPAYDPTSYAEVMHDLVQLFLDIPQPDKALAAAEFASQRQPEDGRAAFLLSLAQSAANQAEQALQSAHLAVALAPDEPDFLRHLARGLQASGQSAEAYQEWQHLIAQHEEPTPEDLLSLAESALINGDAKRSAETCRTLIVDEPENALAHQWLGKALLATGDKTGMDHLRVAIDFDAGLIDAWLTLATYEHEQGDADAALSTLLGAEKAIPGTSAIHAEKAAVYRSLNQLEDALIALRRAHALEINEQVRVNLAVELSKLEIELDLLEDAEYTLEQAHQAHPDNPELAFHYGDLLLNRGKADNALYPLSVAYADQPGNVEISVRLAEAYLAVGQNIHEAETLLESALALDNQHGPAQVLLAEAQVATGQHNKARKSLDALARSPLNEEPEWRKRLTLAKAIIETKSGNPAEAIRQLEALEKGTSKDLNVLDALCSAYREAGRGEEAFQIAHQVYLSSGQDQRTLLWYSRQAEAAHKPDEAVLALNKVVDDGQPSPDLLLRLAELEWTSGKQAAARDTLSTLFALDSIKVADLEHAANFLCTQGADKEAISYLEVAIELSQAENPNLFQQLSAALNASSQSEKALDAIEKSVALAPNNPSYLVSKAALFQQIGRPQTAIQTLDQALELLPQDAELLAGKARLLAAEQDWASALDAVEVAFAQDVGNPELLAFAANLAADHLQPERARALIAAANSFAKTFEIACLDVELALDSGAGVEAAKALAPLIETDPEQARVLALQSTLAIDKRDATGAEQLYKKALKALGALSTSEKQAPDYATTLYSIAQAALATRHWESALELFGQVAAAQPNNARAQFGLAKSYVLRAEFYQLCQVTQVLEHLPAETAVGKQCHKAAISALKAAQALVPFSAAQVELLGWMARSDLRFDPTAEFDPGTDKFPRSGPEAAALAYAARLQGNSDQVKELLKQFSRSSEMLVQFALARQTEDNEEALSAVKLAAKLAPQEIPQHALLASIAYAAGDQDVALHAIEHALVFWPEEARWHALAADIFTAREDFASAEHHAQQAAQLEENYAPHHMALGELHMAKGAYASAAAAMDKAGELARKREDYWLEAAHAHLLNNDFDTAEQRAKQAGKINPGNIKSFLAQVEIALKRGFAEKAAELLEPVLDQAPDETDALRLWAETLFALGHTKEALAILERGRKQSEEPLPWLIRRAQMLPHVEGLGSDVRALQELAQQNQDDASVLLALSQAQAEAGDLKAAIQSAQQALKLARQLPLIQQARLAIHLGRLLKLNGQLDQSLHQLDEAAKLADHLVDIHLERGEVFLARRQHAEALKAFELAAQVAPSDPKPHLKAAQALKEAKDYAGAEKGLRKAAELSPKDRSVQRQLAAVMALNLVHQPQEIGTQS